MKLLDAIEVIDENIDVLIKNDDEKLIASYDGKESIPAEMNALPVTGLTLHNKKLIIYVSEEVAA